MSASATIARAPQHLQALERANEVRLARADLKRRIAQGHVSAAEIVLACPPEVEGMAVAHLLMSQRRWGPPGGRKFPPPTPPPQKKNTGPCTPPPTPPRRLAPPRASPASGNRARRTPL